MAQSGKAVETVEEIQARLQKQLENQTQLLQVSQRLASSFDLAKTMPDVVRSALQATKAGAVRVAILSSGEYRSFGAGEHSELLAPLDQPILKLARETGPKTINDLSNSSGSQIYQSLAGQLGAAGWWPLQTEGRYQGVLWLGYRLPHIFTESETTFISTLAALAAAAIANARSYQEALNGRKRLEAVLSGTSDPVLVVEQDGTISLMNHAAEDLFGLKAQEILAQPIAAVFQDYPRLVRFFESGTHLDEDEEWTGPDERTFSPRLSKVDAGTGEADSYVLILRDITHFKRLNKNQAEFVRLVSHDLRSPLTYMQGFASLLSMTGDLNERQRGFVEKILTGISQITTLVDNIQDAGRWDPETGFYEMSREPSDLAAIIQDIVSNHQEVARKQNITLEAAIAPNIPIVNVDHLMVERALINLVSNAIKYSPNGGEVTVSVELADDSVVICVSDTGLGIAPEHIPLLFQRGGRIVTPEIKKNRIKGSGLGLFIVRSVARWHGGDVWVESQPGKGSRFFFSIPLSEENLPGRRG